MRAFDQCYLYTFVDAAYLNGRPIRRLASELCDGGSDVIQLRAKGCAVDEVQRMAEEIAPITERAGVHLVINDHPEVAARMPRPFVHLGQEDFFDAGFHSRAGLEARVHHTQTPPARLRLGLSTHAPEQAERALAAEPDYIAIGPVFATGTKPGAKPVTLDYVRWAARHVPIPWFAIGGITLDNLDEVLAAGARRICVVSAILRAPSVPRACQQFRTRLESALAWPQLPI